MNQLPLLDVLDRKKPEALLKVIDMAPGRKRLRDNVQSLLASTAA